MVHRVHDAIDPAVQRNRIDIGACTLTENGIDVDSVKAELEQSCTEGGETRDGGRDRGFAACRKRQAPLKWNQQSSKASVD